jgi:hypothetical protein
MAIQVQGNGGTTAEVDGTTFRALRTTPRPLEYSGFGHYRLATTVALVATQAANGTLFSFRWGDATRFCVLEKLRLELIQTSAATATIMPSYQVFIGRVFSVSDSAGSAITITGNNMKKRTSTMNTTLVSDIRKSTAIAGLTAGTRTLDAEPIIEMATNSTITTPNPIVYRKELEMDQGDGVHPYVFAQNEGFIVRGPTVVFGAAGTANLLIDLAWAEVAAY